MPELVTSTPTAICGYGLQALTVGCYGKIPARGDFVRLGLPRGFVDAWDAWVAQMLAASRDALGDDWLGAWLEAPIWHFALGAGICGADAAIGLWMPSVDRVGRHFPLTIAALVVDTTPAELICDGGGFLDAAATAGVAAVTGDVEPEELLTRVRDAVAQPPALPPTDPTLCPPAGALWWTAGAPRVPAAVVATPGLPDASVFLTMLDAGAGNQP